MAKYGSFARTAVGADLEQVEALMTEAAAKSGFPTARMWHLAPPEDWPVDARLPEPASGEELHGWIADA